ncbi:hypothetical protein AGMMS49938_14280 [Fibrobacterales bacterium]|nr:hypothetical protein AGMMS49938_14280 [Fibrobacterales bacterium]
MYESVLETQYRKYTDRIILLILMVFGFFRMLVEFISEKYADIAITGVAVATLFVLIYILQKKNIKSMGFWLPLICYLGYLAASFAMSSFVYLVGVYCLIATFSALYFNLNDYFKFTILTQIINLLLVILLPPATVGNAFFMNIILTLCISVMFYILVFFATNKSNEAGKAFISFNALMQTTPNILILIDPDKRVKYMSKSAVQILGDTENPNYLTGRDFLSLFTDGATKDAFGKILNSKHSYSSYVKLDLGNGLRTYDVRMGKIHDKNFSQIFFHINDITDFARLKDEAEYNSVTDTLTKLPNRRSFDKQIHIEWNRAMRDNVNVAFLMIDIDHFKNYNDTYGHLQGDELLKMAGKIFSRTLKRSSDFVARFGGEEFAIILPATNIDRAITVAENLRKNCEAEVILTKGNEETKFTISIGVCAVIPKKGSDEDYSLLLEEADKALYRAKEEGRNRVCAAEISVN